MSGHLQNTLALINNIEVAVSGSGDEPSEHVAVCGAGALGDSDEDDTIENEEGFSGAVNEKRILAMETQLLAHALESRVMNRDETTSEVIEEQQAKEYLQSNGKKYEADIDQQTYWRLRFEAELEQKNRAIEELTIWKRKAKREEESRMLLESFLINDCVWRESDLRRGNETEKRSKTKQSPSTPITLNADMSASQAETLARSKIHSRGVKFSEASDTVTGENSCQDLSSVLLLVRERTSTNSSLLTLTRQRGRSRGNSANAVAPFINASVTSSLNFSRSFYIDSNSEATTQPISTLGSNVTSYPMFDAVVVVGLSENKSSTEAESMPDIIWQYPPNIDIPAVSEIPYFCFPDGVPQRQLERTQSGSALNELLYAQSYSQSNNRNRFVFLLTTDQGILYGICVLSDELLDDLPSFVSGGSSRSVMSYRSRVSSKDPSSFAATRRCYCLLSRFPYFSLHFDILFAILGGERLRRMVAFAQADAELTSDDVEEGNDIINQKIVCNMLSCYQQITPPAPGDSLIFHISDHLPTIKFSSPLGNSTVKQLAYYGFSTLFRRLSLTTILDTLGCLLTESSILVVCSEVGILSSMVLALMPLLGPLTWQGMFIPVLPSNERYEALLDAPVPFILGVQRLPEASSHAAYAILDVDHDEVRVVDRVSTSAEDSSATSGAPKIYGYSKLQSKLKSFASALSNIGTPVKRTESKVGQMVSSAPSFDDAHGLIDGVLAAMHIYYISFLDRLNSRSIAASYDRVFQSVPDHDSSDSMLDIIISKFPEAERPFIDLFLQTQMLSAYCDKLSTHT